MFIPDKTKKTVRLLVRIKDSSVVRFDGAPLPKLEDGTLGDLILPASSLTDRAERQELETESAVELLPARSLVFVGLNPKMMKGKQRGLIEASDLKIGPAPDAPITLGSAPQAPRTLARHGYYRFAEVVLLESLKLRFRGDKEPTLESCTCAVPVLGKNARSLNHAFTLLSTEFETERISHTGNVFTRVFFNGKSRWHSLNEARGKIDLTGY
jgi:hypothetical protein